MHKALKPKVDIDRLYISRKDEINVNVIIEDYVEASIQGVEDYIKKSKEKLIKAAKNSIGNVSTNRKTTKTKKHKWEEKQLKGYFKWQTGKIKHMRLKGKS